LTKRPLSCQNCLREIEVEVYSAGLSDVIPFVCPEDSTVLLVSLYDKMLDKLVDRATKVVITDDDFAKIEGHLRPCSDGGRFRHDAPPRCPRCRAPLRLPPLSPSEFVVVGRMVDGEKESMWID